MNKLLFRTSLLAFTLGVTSIQSAMAGGSNTMMSLQSQDSQLAKNNHNKFANDAFTSSADQQLNKKIRDQISKGWIWDSYKNVILKTNNGIVTLSGKISSLDNQQKLVNEIQKIEGVKAVTNQLFVERSTW